MSYSSVRPDTQKDSQAKKLKAEVHSGDVAYAAFIGCCFIQSRVYWLSATKIRRLSPAYILTYIFAEVRGGLSRMPRKSEVLCSAATLWPKTELQFIFHLQDFH